MALVPIWTANDCLSLLQYFHTELLASICSTAGPTHVLKYSNTMMLKERLNALPHPTLQNTENCTLYFT